jgi:hypothetical protein
MKLLISMLVMVATAGANESRRQLQVRPQKNGRIGRTQPANT